MMAEPRKRSNPVRVALVIGGIFLWCGLIGARLVQLQVFRHEEFTQQAALLQQVTRFIKAPRGVIYDCHMDEFASSVTVSTVVAAPRSIHDIPAAAKSLASILNMDAGELQARMRNPARKNFMFVKHRIDPKDEGRVEALGIDGIYLVEESMRVYPNRELASHVVGFANLNGDGGAGVELQYDHELKGTEGQISFDVDARRRSFRGRVEKPPVQGNSLVLSIDKSIQYIAERELAAGVEDANARAGVAIVMDSDRGRILALAGYPGFNCNAYNEYAPDFWRNRAVSDFFEPGSTFKVVVATAALEAGLTWPDKPIDCQMGSMTIGGHVFHDHQPYGILTFNEVLEHSSNIGAAKLGLLLGEQRLYEALRTFGFGSRTGIDLPGESVGLVRDMSQWSALSVAAISFGQEVGVTSMQILTAINAIANGGYLVRPSVVDRVIDSNGDLVRVHEPESTRIMRLETAAAVRDAFEGVVLRGTGRAAALEGYRAAGKTGTAQKIIDGRYSNSKYLASFIGFAPLPRPRITVLVQIDEPKGGYYGGAVAAPVFRAIAQGALLQLGVPPDQTVPVKMPKFDPSIVVDAEDFRPNATPVLPLTAPAGTKDGTEQDGVITVRVASASVAVPDFSGMSKRTVVERCQELGLKVQTSGTGTAVFQLPPAGTLVPAGDTCSVTFARAKSTPPHQPSAATGGTATGARQRVEAGRR
ncbi:MAG: transpeptidase family protein [Acidobacteriia bacterium]|nr:transpeptidase family protein [Terriglobia bacterium]